MVLWGLFGLVMRYLFIGPFYSDTPRVEDWVSAGQVIPTILLYYFFGYYVFPKYLRQLNIQTVLSWLLAWHVLLYEVNYAFFWYLQKINISNKIERDWTIFQNAGLFGFISSVEASLYSFFYTFSFALVFLGVLAVKEVLSYRTKNLKLERDKLNLELDFLKAQVNPHFLFNTLNSVYAHVFDSDEQAADLVLRLSELMRYNLYETDVARIALDKELGYVQNYLDLERNRLSDQYVVIDYEQSGNPSAYQITPLLLIAFVENAFKHGVKGATESAYVQVSANVTAGQLVFRVENSVPHRREISTAEPLMGTTTKSGGIGLGNVRRRLDALYKDRHELVVTPTEDSYTVVLTIQVETVSAVVSTRV